MQTKIYWQVDEVPARIVDEDFRHLQQLGYDVELVKARACESGVWFDTWWLVAEHENKIESSK